MHLGTLRTQTIITEGRKNNEDEQRDVLRNSTNRGDWYIEGNKGHCPALRISHGEFFLWGEGGGMSKYAEYCPGGGYCWGEGIDPISEDEAKEWLEAHATVDEYIEIFGEPEE